MEFKKCSRCGNFYVSNGFVCPKCSPKDTFEYSTFKSYISENGLGESADIISSRTGISVKNVNRFLTYGENTNNTKNNVKNAISCNTNESLKNIKENENGITFLI